MTWCRQDYKCQWAHKQRGRGCPLHFNIFKLPTFFHDKQQTTGLFLSHLGSPRQHLYTTRSINTNTHNWFWAFPVMSMLACHRLNAYDKHNHSSYVLTSQRVSGSSVHGLCLEIPFLSRILTQSLRNAPKQRDVEPEQMKKGFLSCVGFSVDHTSHYFHPFFHYLSCFVFTLQFLMGVSTITNIVKKDKKKIPILHYTYTIMHYFLLFKSTVLTQLDVKRSEEVEKRTALV